MNGEMKESANGLRPVQTGSRQCVRRCLSSLRGKSTRVITDLGRMGGARELVMQADAAVFSFCDASR